MKMTPIYNRHVSLGAKMVDFHGWLLPIQYKGIMQEHLSVRKNVGLFDVCHMGKFIIEGKDAYAFVQYLVTNNLDKITSGQVLYSPICNESGGMLDDLLIYLFDREKIMLIVNASNIEKDFSWIKSKKGSYNVNINNISYGNSILAVQGPNSCLVLEKFLNKKMDSLKRFHFVEESGILISRTGYTGEDGFELIVESSKALQIWDELIKLGSEPVGLGARDTLRLEKGYILYGSDAGSDTSPYEAGIGWTVDLEKLNFIGKEALLNNDIKKTLVRIELLEKGVPRHGNNILNSKGTEVIGKVTSGTYSPSLQKGIAMGYIDINSKDLESIFIDIRGRNTKGIIKSKKKANKLVTRAKVRV